MKEDLFMKHKANFVEAVSSLSDEQLREAVEELTLSERWSLRDAIEAVETSDEE